MCILWKQEVSFMLYSILSFSIVKKTCPWKKGDYTNRYHSMIPLKITQLLEEYMYRKQFVFIFRIAQEKPKNAWHDKLGHAFLSFACSCPVPKKGNDSMIMVQWLLSQKQRMHVKRFQKVLCKFKNVSNLVLELA